MQDSKEVDATSAFLSEKAVRNIYFYFGVLSLLMRLADSAGLPRFVLIYYFFFILN